MPPCHHERDWPTFPAISARLPPNAIEIGSAVSRTTLLSNQPRPFCGDAPTERDFTDMDFLLGGPACPPNIRARCGSTPCLSIFFIIRNSFTYITLALWVVDVKLSVRNPGPFSPIRNNLRASVIGASCRACIADADDDDRLPFLQSRGFRSAKRGRNQRSAATAGPSRSAEDAQFLPERHTENQNGNCRWPS